MELFRGDILRLRVYELNQSNIQSVETNFREVRIQRQRRVNDRGLLV